MSNEKIQMAFRVASNFIKPDRGWYIPKGSGVEKYVPEGTDLEVYKWIDERGRIMAMGFVGKVSKPSFYYVFKDERRRDAYIDAEVDKRRAWLRRKQERMDERREFRHDLQMGDVLVSSWGYDQTNVDFYEVVGVTEKSVVIQKVDSKVVRREMGSDYVVPVPGRYAGSKMVKRVGPRNNVRITSYSNAYKWDGSPKYETAMGYGH